MRLRLTGLFVAFFVALTGAGCSCGGEPPTTDPDAGPGTEQPDAGPDGGPGTTPDGGPDGGPGYQCVALGSGCAASNITCCQGVCAGSGFCEVPEQTTCSGAGEACNSSGDCCAGRTCTAAGTCSTDACRQTGQACSDNSQCCTLTCSGGVCADLPPATNTGGGTAATCANGATKVVGQACSSGAECCSTNCQGGICVSASYCQVTGDICTANDDCCSGRCSGTAGAPGRCFESTGGCTLDGNPCTSGTGCCSKICTDLGYGTTVCAPASGCRVTGNACAASDDCCGGEPLGTVACQDFKCDQGQACNEVGMVCGRALKPDGGEVKVNAPAPNKCCEDINGTSCKLDNGGIPRCFGGASATCPTGYTGETGCCIEEGQECRFRDQCCNGALCLENADGGPGYTCQGVTCLQSGSLCSPDGGAGGCCAGTECLQAASDELTTIYACQTPSTDGTTDGGTADAGTSCKVNDATCSTSSECCSSVCDTTTNKCVEQQTCQPEGGNCTSGADCCLGYQCVQNADGGAGTTCQAGGCSTAGQQCTQGSQCCSGLQCLDPNGATCTGANCACTVIIG